MELYVDSADLDAVALVSAYYPVEGFTTNPRILAASDEEPGELMGALRSFAHERKMKVFVQVTGDTASAMVEQAQRLAGYFGEGFVVKLPAVKEGYRATRLCKEAGIEVCVTVVHSALQALLAAKAGADYVAPYVSRIDAIGGDGVAAVAEMVELIKGNGYTTKVLGASFRTSDQVRRVLGAGAGAVTLKPAMFDSLIEHASTEESMRLFEEAWEGAFGGREVDDLLG